MEGMTGALGPSSSYGAFGSGLCSWRSGCKGENWWERSRYFNHLGFTAKFFFIPGIRCWITWTIRDNEE